MDKRIVNYISAGLPADSREYGVYPRSLHYAGDMPVFIADAGDRDVLVAESGTGFRGERFEVCGKAFLCCELDRENAERLRALFPFTAPSPVLGSACSIGVGDRLGLATYGHIRVFERFEASPVFAQQSIRELNLTGRSFADVIDSASYAVFRENFTRPFGADGDHLKTFEEIDYALASGCTMITLDCSEHIFNAAASMSLAELEALCPEDAQLERRYLSGGFELEGVSIVFDRESLLRCRLVYGKAIEFAAQVYHRYFAAEDARAQLEVSIDETLTPTKPEEHFFVANELALRGARAVSVAPRFCGEFQKGVDYRGDVAQFERELKVHQLIAKHFGYKLSVHSGSDKFSVFPLIAENCGGNFHLKTAGTNWLEAMTLVAELAPALYREIHAFALARFEEATRYYHVSTDLNRVPDIAALTDAELPGLFELDDARQLIHITYGLILSEKNPDGTFLFRDRLYRFWHENQEAYACRLEKHIGRHLSSLNVPLRDEN